MKSQDLYNKRITPAFDKMYRASKCGVPELSNISFSWEDIIKFSAVADEPFSYGRKNVTMIPFRSFYLPQDQFTDICKEAAKGLHYTWRWAYKSEILEKHYTLEEAYANQPKRYRYTDKQEYLAQMHEWRRKYDSVLFEEYLTEINALVQQLDLKTIGRKEYNHKEAELAKKYGMERRSQDAESVRITLALSSSPNSSETNYTKPWNIVKDFVPNMTFQEVYEKTKDMDAASIYCFYWNWKAQNSSN